jgi:acyl-coenzyme A synthetase/AMP-(fatty) acid ligase
MTTSSFMQREYWDFICRERPTSLAGVPYHYEVMLRMRMLEKDFPGLQTFTQAGGRLDPDRVEEMAKLCERHDWRFFVMYGQTEATARISYVPPGRLAEKIGSIGIAIPGGELRLDLQTGELIYSGPNVMLGYAESRADLARGDDLHGELRTGDLAKRDEDGYYYIVGRQKRFLKIYGRRFGLDEMESVIGRHVNCSVACFGTDDHVLIAVDGKAPDQTITQVIKDVLKIHPNAFRIMRVVPLPRLANGKVDYQTLTQLGKT